MFSGFLRRSGLLPRASVEYLYCLGLASPRRARAPGSRAFRERPRERLFIFQGSVYLAVGVPLLKDGALVIFLSAARDRDTHFQLISLIIHRKWYYCQAFLALKSMKLRKLFFSEEELAAGLGLVALRRVRRLVGRDVEPHQVGLEPAPRARGAHHDVRALKLALA